MTIPMIMPNDREHWPKLTWPAAPNIDDYRVFEQHCVGRVLLLGSTELLLPLCTEAWDLEPVYNNPKIIQRDWFTLNEHWDTIIADGSLTLGEEFAKKLLATVLPNCNRFVARSFLNPNWPTKYAVYFPRAEELTPQPKEYPVSEVYTFYIWNRQNQQY